MTISYFILGRKSSLNVQKVMFAFRDLEIPVTRSNVGGKYGFYAGYESHNPNKLVPTLHIKSPNDHDKFVWESNSIVRYGYLAKHLKSINNEKDCFAFSEFDRWMEWSSSKTIQSPLFTAHERFVRIGGDINAAGTTTTDNIQQHPHHSQQQLQNLDEIGLKAMEDLFKVYVILETNFPSFHRHNPNTDKKLVLTPADYVVAPSLHRFLAIVDRKIPSDHPFHIKVKETLPSLVEYIAKLKRSSKPFVENVVDAERIWYDSPEK